MSKLDTEKLIIGETYIVQYADVSYIGTLIEISSRYSQKYVKETIVVNKKKNITEEIDVLKLNKPQYPVLVFVSEENTFAEKRGIVKRQFNNTHAPLRQFYFTNPILSNENIIKEDVYEWAISKILRVPKNKAAQSNLAVTVKIAKSMMDKNGYTEYSKNYILDRIKNNAIEIIDIKQYEWEQVLESQANQLPFN